MKNCFILLCAGFFLLPAACTNTRSTVQIPAVAPFELPRYLGVWHEAARMPHYFERGMHFVTAEYFPGKDGTIRVRNQGVRQSKNKEIYGVVREKKPGTGELEVSFFRPFYGSYRIIALTPDYSAAIVTSSSKDFAWILVRNPDRAASILPEYRMRLKVWGFDCSKLEFPLMRLDIPPI